MDPEAEHGRFCVAAWSEDEFGRLGVPATTWVDAPAPAPAGTGAGAGLRMIASCSSDEVRTDRI